jgi:hypothetical protein
MMGRLNRRRGLSGADRFHHREARRTHRSVTAAPFVRGTVHPGRQRSGLMLAVVFVLAVILPLAAVATGR